MFVMVTGRPSAVSTSCAHWTIVCEPVNRMSPWVVVLTAAEVTALAATACLRLAFFDQTHPPRLPRVACLNPGERGRGHGVLEAWPGRCLRRCHGHMDTAAVPGGALSGPVWMSGGMRSTVGSPSGVGASEMAAACIA